MDPGQEFTLHVVRDAEIFNIFFSYKETSRWPKLLYLRYYAHKKMYNLNLICFIYHFKEVELA